MRRPARHSALAGLSATPGSGVSPTEADDAADKAMDCLRQAFAKGYRNVGQLKTESAFDPLRSREDFILLMMDMAFPTEPLESNT